MTLILKHKTNIFQDLTRSVHANMGTKFLGTKGLGNENSQEQKVRGMKGPGNESSQERNILPFVLGTKGLAYEKSVIPSQIFFFHM